MTEKVYSKAEILEMAKELGLALASSQLIIDYRKAECDMANDAEACNLTRIFKQKHNALAALQLDPNSSEDHQQRLAEELDKADNNMKAYPPIAAYYSAGNTFNSLIYQINQLLKFYSMEQGEESQFESSSGCNSCNRQS